MRSEKLIKIINDPDTICTLTIHRQMYYLLPALSDHENNRCIFIQTYSTYSEKNTEMIDVGFILLPITLLERCERWDYHEKFLDEPLGLNWGSVMYVDTHYNQLKLEKVRGNELYTFCRHRGMAFPFKCFDHVKSQVENLDAKITKAAEETKSRIGSMFISELYSQETQGEVKNTIYAQFYNKLRDFKYIRKTIGMIIK